MTIPCFRRWRNCAEKEICLQSWIHPSYKHLFWGPRQISVFRKGQNIGKTLDIVWNSKKLRWGIKSFFIDAIGCDKKNQCRCCCYKGIQTSKVADREICGMKVTRKRKRKRENCQNFVTCWTFLTRSFFTPGTNRSALMKFATATIFVLSRSFSFIFCLYFYKIFA